MSIDINLRNMYPPIHYDYDEQTQAWNNIYNVWKTKSEIKADVKRHVLTSFPEEAIDSYTWTAEEKEINE